MAHLSALRAQAADLICRGDAWTDEINQLNALRRARGKTCAPGTPALLKFIRGEVRSVRNLLSRLDAISPDPDDGGERSPGHRDSELLPLVNKLQHSLTSNFPAAEVFWGIVKRCRGLVSLKREVSAHTFTPTCALCSGVDNAGNNNPGRCPPIRKQSPKHLALVDAIVSDGEEWLRVIGLNERQVLMQMARMGWDWVSSPSHSPILSSSDQKSSHRHDDNGHDSGEEEEGDEDDDLSILRSVRRLVSASAANPYNYRPPRIRVVFTRIRSGQSPDIDLLMDQLRSLPHVTVECSDSQFLRSPVPDWETVAVERLMLDDMKGLTSTLNIDTTILINLASDISHTRVEIQEWHKPLIIQQIHSELSEEEEGGGGGTLHKKLYPALVGRRLVVTRPAAAQFLGIVRQIGSETENQRARLILDTNANTDLTGDVIKSEGAAAAGGWSGKRGDELRRGLQQLSIYPVPGDLHLPIQVIDTSTTDAAASEGSPGAGDEEREMERMSSVLRQLTRLNREVFLFGWRSGYTTVTGNNEAVKTIIRAIEDRSKRNKNKGEEGVVMMQGPTVWLYPYMRALITKGPPPQT